VAGGVTGAILLRSPDPPCPSLLAPSSVTSTASPTASAVAAWRGLRGAPPRRRHRGGGQGRQPAPWSTTRSWCGSSARPSLARRVRSAYVRRSTMWTARGGRAYLVMPAAPRRGRSPQRLRIGRPQPGPTFAPVRRDVLQGLGDAHGAGVVHRDLKPGNIFLEPRRGADDSPRQPPGPRRLAPVARARRSFLDFGVCKLGRERRREAHRHRRVGGDRSPYHGAETDPRRLGDVDARADLTPSRSSSSRR